ncbi:unnamed protein product [Schistosoma curassoni]|uniref:S-adenosylmethionine synthase n=1 Tax=Schistosoma curassoni TaxID=6186 RepID=A0A183JZS4_9TREM|nr:unnamed protein product [Schistosoma curassoni]
MSTEKIARPPSHVKVHGIRSTYGRWLSLALTGIDDLDDVTDCPRMPSFTNGGNAESDTFLFTSESVGEGHPESFVKSGLILVGGEISSNAVVDIQKTVRDVVKHIGYDDTHKGLDYKNCNVLTVIEQQSADIAKGVHEGRKIEDIGAGDQGLMFGYATDETEECMPLTVTLSHALNKRIATCRRNGILPWAGPDSKTQVTVEYLNDHGACRPLRVHTVVISTQHDEHVTLEKVRADLMEYVIKEVIPTNLLDEKTKYHLNPAGRFVIGGPQSDAGLTGRKIIVDTYGGWGAHGGGAFSGKDYSKVDRSAAYAARWVAKSLVKSGLCRRVLVQVTEMCYHGYSLLSGMFL